MSSEQSSERVPVGRCPEHGLVSGDDVDFRFPNVPECNLCGSELTRATIADKEIIAENVQ